jgi:DNA-binding transcriptional ArsR family regulator
MENKIIAARLQDINEGLVRQIGGITEAYYIKSKRLGAAGRICNIIKGQDVIKNPQILFIASGELGISGDTVDRALDELEEIGYVTLYRKGGEISKIEERIPLLEDQYSQIGEKWLDSSPTEIERATIEIIDDLMVAPQREREIIKKYGIDNEAFGIIGDVGKNGAFYKNYDSPVDGSSIAYSPLYHDENPEKIMALFDKYPEEDVSGKIRTIRAYQGRPVDAINDPVLMEAIRIGCIPTPSVDSSRGRKHFAFTPLKGVGKLEKNLLEKARAIISCVRYGQHFAVITRIDDPLLILRALERRKRIGSHSEILRQYALLHKLGVGIISKDPTSIETRYTFNLLDTPENMRALELAIQYLTIKEPVKREPKVKKVRQLFLPGMSGMYGTVAKTRIDLQSVKTTTLSDDSINHLNHLLIGGSSGY